MNLYHFSIERHAESIRELGVLSVAEKRRRGMYPPGWQSPPEAFAGEDELAWLTRDPESYAGIVGSPDPIIRVEVEAVGAQRWAQAANRLGVDALTRKAYRAAALMLSPFNDDRDWYVVERMIPPELIVGVEAVADLEVA